MRVNKLSCDHRNNYIINGFLNTLVLINLCENALLHIVYTFYNFKDKSLVT